VGRVVEVPEEEPRRRGAVRLGESAWSLGRTVAVISLIGGAVVLVPCMFDESWRNQLVSMLPTQMRAYLAQHSGK